MRTASHVFFDHTGDFGVDLTAPTREALYEQAARAWTELLTDAPGSVVERESRPIEVRGFDATDLLVALGNELLYWFETDGWLASRLTIEELDETDLRGMAYGEAFDSARHPIARPVKAVTHHGADVRNDAGTWRGRLIFDL
jgi:SHS2 domain-containing protein